MSALTPREKPILLLGLGNPLQADDGVGCRTAQVLEKESLPDSVQVLDGGTPGIGLLSLIEGRERVIVIDAAEMGRAAGAVVRLAPDDIAPSGAPVTLSLHTAGFADALALAQALKMPLPEMVVFGVQPARVEWSEELSPAVQAAVGPLVKAVLREIGASHGE